MSNNLPITIHEGHTSHKATLVEGAISANSLTLNGRRFAVIAKEDELAVVLDTLNILYPGTVTSAKPLSGRVSRSEANVTGLEQVYGMWMQQDETYLAELKRNFAKAYFAKSDANPNELKDFLLQYIDQNSNIADFESRFGEAISKKSVELLLPLLNNVSEESLRLVIHGDNLDVPMRQDAPCNRWIFSNEAKQELGQYVQNVGFSGVITLQDAKGIPFSIASQGIDPATPFAIHSVGKVFTGILALHLVHLGKISKTILDEPIQLAPAVTENLPKGVQTHLKENRITLRQLMLHQGGLGEYLDKYIDAIDLALKSGAEPPNMNSPEDFVKYAEEKTYPIGKTHYSNLGLLLVGLSIQYLIKKPFNDLLHDYIIAPAKIERFSSQKPEDAIVNPSDPVAGHLCGSPAGGYWTTSADLCKFSAWISQQCKDPAFLQLIETYGDEFYSHGKLHHDGIIPSSSACLTSFPEHNVTIAIVSDKNHPGATEMNTAIENHMLHTSN